MQDLDLEREDEEAMWLSKNRKFIFIEIPEIYIQDNDLGIFRSNFDIRN